MIKHIFRLVRWRFLIPRYLYAFSDYISRLRISSSPDYRIGYSYNLASKGVISISSLVDQRNVSHLRTILKAHLQDYLSSTSSRKANALIPFTNLLSLRNCLADPAYSCLFNLVFDKNLLEFAHDYLGPRFCLDSIQLLYSFPAGTKLSENQYWHKDYGSAKTIHIYLPITEMANESPFYIISPTESKNISKRPWVRRISPRQMNTYLNSSQQECLTFDSEDIIAMDPAKSYHRYASSNSHAALFITFNSFPLYYKQDIDIINSKTMLLERLIANIPSMPKEHARSMIRLF